MKQDLKIGQSVFVVPLHGKNLPYFADIDYIGNKWFTLRGLWDMKFSTVDLLQKEKDYGHSRDFEIHLTKQSYDDKIERLTNINDIKNLIYSIDLEKSRHILSLIKNTLK